MSRVLTGRQNRSYDTMTTRDPPETLKDWPRDARPQSESQDAGSLSTQPPSQEPSSARSGCRRTRGRPTWLGSWFYFFAVWSWHTKARKSLALSALGFFISSLAYQSISCYPLLQFPIIFPPQFCWAAPAPCGDFSAPALFLLACLPSDLCTPRALPLLLSLSP